MNARLALVVSLGASSLSLFCGSVAWAQSEDAGAQTVIRRGLIEAAQAAFDRREFAQCIESGQRAATIRDTGSLRKLIAECQMSSRDYVGALGSAELCISILRRDTNALQRNQLLAACERINVEAQAHTGRLTIVTPTPAPAGLRVTVNGSELPSVVWGIPAIVNAGVSLEVRSEASGYVAFVGSVTVPAAASAEMRVVLVREPSSATASSDAAAEVRPRANTTVARPAQTPTSNAVAVSAPAETRPSRAWPSPLLATGVVMATIGAVGAVAGFAGAGATYGDYQARCAVPTTLAGYDDCTMRMGATQGTIDALTAVGYIGVGFAVIGAGFAVYGATHPLRRESPARVALSAIPLLGPSRAGLAVLARW